MDITSFVIAFLLAGLMLLLIVRLPLAILGNLRTGQRFREGLAATLDELRLSRMLRHLGIDRATYLHREQTLEIQKHMDKCERCDAKSRCDQVLEQEQDDQADVDALGFCANIDDLKAMRGPR